MSRALNTARVMHLRNLGLLQREISDRTGLSRSYVSQLLSDPYRIKEVARKDSYRGVCEVCGDPTNGSDGPGKAPRRCIRHATDPYWTEGVVLVAIQEWVRRRGRPPSSSEWDRQLTDPDGYRFPAKTSVYRSLKSSHAPFAKWADAIEAAGFTRPRSGAYERRRGADTNESQEAQVRGYSLLRRLWQRVPGPHQRARD